MSFITMLSILAEGLMYLAVGIIAGIPYAIAKYKD